jgi:RNase H-fold protein (predicted Holliday junction resolvase)
MNKNILEEINKMLYLNDYKRGNEKYKVQATKLRKEWEEKDRRLRKPEAKKMARADFDQERGALSAMLVTNEVFPTLIDWLEKNKRNISNAQDYVSPSDRLIQELFKYITSRTDDSGKFAIPRFVWANDATLLDKILKFKNENEISVIIIGESKNLDGKPNPIQVKIDELKTELESLGIKVVYHPEIFTTMEARQLQGQTEMTDASAASLILKSFIDTHV